MGDLNPTLEYSDTSETCEKPPEAEAVAPEAPVAAGDAVSSSAAPERGGHARHDFKRHRDGGKKYLNELIFLCGAHILLFPIACVRA